MDGVVYYQVGNFVAQWNRMLTSLFTLKKHWKGPIALVTDSEPPAKIAAELQVVRTVIPPSKSWYVGRTYLSDLSPFDRFVSLDSDTMVFGDISPMIPTDERIVVTPWANLDPNASKEDRAAQLARMASVRFYELVDRGIMHPSHYQALLNSGVPIANTGVLGLYKGLPFAEEWRYLSDLMVEPLQNRVVDDERALQMLLLDGIPCRWETDRYNRLCSEYRRRRPKPDDTVVWHYIGGIIKPIEQEYYATQLEMAEAGWLELTRWQKKWFSERWKKGWFAARS
jgi:hypothetical protein